MEWLNTVADVLILILLSFYAVMLWEVFSEYIKYREEHDKDE